MFTIRKLMRFEAAHVLSSSYSKACQRVHGHSYVVELFFKSKRLNNDGMVLDFGEVKDVAGPLIGKWDHTLITPQDFPGGLNPTAEHMAEYLYKEIKTSISMVSKVRVHETATGWAEYSEED